MEPMAVVAPYLTLTGLDVASIADQALLNDRALEERMADEPMWTVVALDAKTTVGALDQIS
jgi:hypothetical protein